MNINKLKRIAEFGDIDAQNNLGNCYYFGEGVEQNYEEAFKWYKKRLNDIMLMLKTV